MIKSATLSIIRYWLFVVLSESTCCKWGESEEDLLFPFPFFEQRLRFEDCRTCTEGRESENLRYFLSTILSICRFWLFSQVF